MPGEWSADPLAERPADECCTDGTCPLCQVKAAGARTLAVWVGEDYDAFEASMQHHFREMCGDVMAVMSESMIEQGLVTPREQDA